MQKLEGTPNFSHLCFLCCLRFGRLTTLSQVEGLLKIPPFGTLIQAPSIPQAG